MHRSCLYRTVLSLSHTVNNELPYRTGRTPGESFKKLKLFKAIRLLQHDPEVGEGEAHFVHFVVDPRFRQFKLNIDFEAHSHGIWKIEPFRRMVSRLN